MGTGEENDYNRSGNLKRLSGYLPPLKGKGGLLIVLGISEMTWKVVNFPQEWVAGFGRNLRNIAFFLKEWFFSIGNP